MESNKPFFPITEDLGTDFQGISTRDYIAIETMKSIIIGRYINQINIVGHTYPEFVAELAYEFTDALLKQSNYKK